MRDGKVEIVDSNTGRVKEGSRWSASLHQARLWRTASCIHMRQQPASWWKRRVWQSAWAVIKTQRSVSLGPHASKSVNRASHERRRCRSQCRKSQCLCVCVLGIAIVADRLFWVIRRRWRRRRGCKSRKALGRQHPPPSSPFSATTDASPA